ncbi:MAG TPA: hypothetical protein VL133_03950 [Devosia sp.]|nr:hypothetical protein [Devosia sp.]
MKQSAFVDGEAMAEVEGIDVTHLVGTPVVIDMQAEPQRAAFNAYRVAFRANEAKPDVPNAVALVKARNDLADILGIGRV